jgi:hypothetical protein
MECQTNLILSYLNYPGFLWVIFLPHVHIAHCALYDAFLIFIECTSSLASEIYIDCVRSRLSMLLPLIEAILMFDLLRSKFSRLWALCTLLTVAWVNMGLARDAVVGQKMKRHLADSCAHVMHMIHSVIAGQPFLCRLNYPGFLWILFLPLMHIAHCALYDVFLIFIACSSSIASEIYNIYRLCSF